MIRHSPQDAFVAVRRSAERRHAQHAAVFAAAQLVNHVLSSAGKEPRLERFTLTGQRLAIHPIGKVCNGYLAHRFPTSLSR